MPIKLQGSSVKLMCSGHGIAKIYCENKAVYSSGNTVTYYVDSGAVYQEEVDEGASCLRPQNFTPAKNGWEFAGWRQDTAANSNVLSNLTMDNAPITLYAVFRQTITVTYYNNSITASSASGYRYYNNENIVNPTFTLTQTALSGWTARGWSTSTAGNGGISYNNGAAFTRDSNVTLYGMYQQAITLTYYNGSTSAASTSGTRYYNPGSGGVVNPTFTLTPATLSGWTFRGWATSSAAAAGIAHSSISGTALDVSTTVYATYYQTITLSYNGNGNTGGSTAAQTGTRYYNTGNYSNPSFTLAANGFTKTDYSFQSWALGSASGTQYAAYASVTLSESTTMYAVWVINTFYPIINGALQSGYYTKAARINIGSYGGYDLPDSVNYRYAYGHYGAKSTGTISQGASISFDTRGCSQVTILPFSYALNGQYFTTSLVVRGDGNQIYNAAVNTEITINVSGYSSMEVTFTALSDNAGFLAGGIQTITCS